MKKLLSFLPVLVLLAACQKQIQNEEAAGEIATAASKGGSKITICHHNAATGTNQTIQITPDQWLDHQAHGDLKGSCNETLTTICEKDWTKKNLDVSTYSDGTPIQQVTNAADLSRTTGAWCYYNFDAANGAVYGKLYNWAAVLGIDDEDANTPNKQLAPTGWHIPSPGEVTDLANCLGGFAVAGGKMKVRGFKYWNSPNTGATNSSGFSALGGGYGQHGDFFQLNYYTAFWTNAVISEADFTTVYGLGNGGEDLTIINTSYRAPYFYIRCVRD